MISEFEGAVKLKISPELLRWFSSYSPKKDGRKLSYQENKGVYYFEEDELDDFNRYLNSPWPKPPKGTRPNIPSGIELEVKKEASHCCPVCRTNIGELAHIEPVSKTLNNHPHNLIYLCPNHHTVYDYGHKYDNVSREDVLLYKNALLTFQISQWKLQGNLIDSYISAINLIGRVKELEEKILECISESEFENLFLSIINKVSELKESKKQPNSVTEIINSIDSESRISNKDKAYQYHSNKSIIVDEVKRSSNLQNCSLCTGNGHTDFYEICPACHGEGLLSKYKLRNIDFDEYDVEDCPLCEGKGSTDHYETCPPCGGQGILSKEQIRSIDFDEY